jgi:hypothetical protein
MKQQWEVERRGVKVTVSVVIWSKSDKHIEECPVSMYETFQDVIDALELKGVKVSPFCMYFTTLPCPTITFPVFPHVETRPHDLCVTVDRPQCG